MPSFRKLKHFENSGPEFIILNREILYKKIKNKINILKKNIDYLILNGGLLQLIKIFEKIKKLKSKKFYLY